MGSYRNQNKQPRYRFNHQITAPTIRLIQDKGGQIGIVSISEARQKAQETGLDLVEIAPKATPPVVKLINFAKFKYQESKKLKAEKKGSKKGELKEVQAKPFIGQGDYQTKLKRTIKFLNSGNKVKLSIKFQGRQIQKPEFGYQLVEKFKND
ncbi:translation initiation factor IF-3, partial [Patescibacteria group bacterium]|nr:translation initiation factor IF-3 [Patescibacteria group bacterium]